MNSLVLDDGDVAAVLAASDLLFDLALLARRDLDAIDNLIHLGVSQANVRQISDNPESQRRFASVDANPPDEMRRPISIAALSRVLSLPLETVRRRSIRLCEAGLLVATPDGLLAPAATFTSDEHIALLFDLDQAAGRTFETLQNQGFFANGDLPRPAHPSGAPPLRAVARLAGEFYLRMLAPLHAWAGDPMDAVIVLSLLRRNQDEAGRGVAGLRLSGPVRIARELRFSAETVRRRLQRMVDRGQCGRDADGFFMPLDVIYGPLRGQLAEASKLNLRRFYRRLAEIGAIGSALRVDGTVSPDNRPHAG